MTDKLRENDEVVSADELNEAIDKVIVVVEKTCEMKTIKAPYKHARPTRRAERLIEQLGNRPKKGRHNIPLPF